MKENGVEDKRVAELKTINPATEEVINRYKIITKEQINDKVKKARVAFDEWKKDSKKRTDLVHDFAQQLRKDKEELAKTATKEMGKAIKEARSEVEKCAWAMEYFADNGKVFSNDEVINADARKTFVTFEPLGVIGSIMPWNFPYWQALRFAAPSLILGNTTDYPPETEDENLVAHTLTITVGDNIHTTGWTAASKDIPESIIKIVNGIKKIVSKEKIV